MSTNRRQKHGQNFISQEFRKQPCRIQQLTDRMHRLYVFSYTLLYCYKDTDTMREIAPWTLFIICTVFIIYLHHTGDAEVSNGAGKSCSSTIISSFSIGDCALSVWDDTEPFRESASLANEASLKMDKCSSISAKELSIHLTDDGIWQACFVTSTRWWTAKSNAAHLKENKIRT